MAPPIKFSRYLALTLAMMVPSALAQPADLTHLGLVQSPGGGYAPDSVLVRFKANAAASDKARARGLVNAQSHRSFQSVPGLEALKLSGRESVADVLARLSRLPFVAYAEPDYLVQKATNDQFYSLLYAIDNTGQPIANVNGTPDADMDVLEAWTVQTGNPELVIAVIDEGVRYDHPDLAANMWTNTGEIPGNGIDDDGNGFTDDVYGYDFYDFDGDPMDEGGHGTHVAGTICAEGNNGIGIVGVVQQCKIMALRFLGPRGGSTSGGIAALDYAVQMGAKISNNSWGGGGFSQALYESIAAARDADHIFLAAAGNDGTNNDASPHYPSNYDLPNVVSVAATDKNDELASFSNYGALSVDIGAPGVEIASTYIFSNKPRDCSDYCYLSGTSMATPNVTGVVALIRSQFPQMGYQEVIDLLYATARPAAAVAGITTTGGIANAEAALAGGEPPTPPLAPTGLTASMNSHSSISLSWVDNSDNEQSFVIERDGQVLTTSIATNSAAYTDQGLNPETTYSYRVKARNAGGDSEWSNVASATTDVAPPYQTVFATAESTVAGTVIAGSVLSTQALDGVSEEIRERESGGRQNNRYSYLQHDWSINAPAGLATLSVTGSSGVSVDGDSFELAYSTGGGFTTFCTLAVGTPSTCSVSFELASAATVTVRVTDTDQTRGNRSLDTIAIDYIELLVASSGPPPAPPAAPSNVAGDNSIAGEITVSWTDASDNESRFDVQRSDDNVSWTTLGSVNAGVTTYTDATVASLTTYYYRVIAANSGGDTASPSIAVTSAEYVAPDITLTALGRKVKGWQFVDASWMGANGAQVTLYRDGAEVCNTTASTCTDELNVKGAAVYVYQVCPSGDAAGSATCSNAETVVF
jgi:serine protease